VRYRSGRWRSKALFGFMALRGRDVVMISERAKTEDVIKFIELVRRLNPSKPILTILDNAQIHRAGDVVGRAKELDMHFVHPPPYSPDLNPIEFAWKDLKRELSAILNYDQAIQEAEGKALQLMALRKNHYSKKWQSEFIHAEKS